MPGAESTEQQTLDRSLGAQTHAAYRALRMSRAVPAYEVGVSKGHCGGLEGRAESVTASVVVGVARLLWIAVASPPDGVEQVSAPQEDPLPDVLRDQLSPAAGRRRLNATLHDHFPTGGDE